MTVIRDNMTYIASTSYFSYYGVPHWKVECGRILGSYAGGSYWYYGTFDELLGNVKTLRLIRFQEMPQ